MLQGQCLCGAVRFHGEPDTARGVTVCHCGQCRRWGGGGPLVAIRFRGGIAFDAGAEEGGALSWHRSSEHGERGFCARCGSSLFWRAPGAGNDASASLGALQEDHGLTIGAHIWVEDKPGWYDYADDRPRMTSDEWMAARRAGSGG